MGGEYISRNAGRRTAFSSLGLRVGRSFRIRPGVAVDGLLEIFNLLNRANELSRNTTFGPGEYPASPLPAFGRITAVGEPRTVQLGIRARF
jgi:hypothetical protein